MAGKTTNGAEAPTALVSTLTLVRGDLKVDFDEITVEGDLAMKRESRLAMRAVRARYADLFAVLDKPATGQEEPATGQEERNKLFRDHDDFLDYQHFARIEGLVLPALRAALKPATNELTLAQLNKSTTREVHDCLKAVVKLNPDLADTFPEAADDPN